MKYSKQWLVFSIIACLLWSIDVYAQRPKKGDKDNNLDNNNGTQFLIENLVEENDAEEFSLDTQFEYLEGFAANPLDINNADQQDLEELGLLSAIQIQALLNYRKRFGQIFSPYELQGVPVFDMQTIRNILPYISFSPSKDKGKLNFKRMFKYGKNQVFLRYQQILEKQDGFVDTTGTYFLGSPDKWYLRYNMSYKNKMSMGVTLEKDAGEQFLNPLSGQSNARFIDYFSAHFYLRDLSKNVKAVAVGDYRVYFGQGLTAWDGFRIRKGVDVLNIKRISIPLKAYTSVNESLFLRGAAGSFAFGREGNIESTVFVSHRFQNGNISAINADTSGGSFDVAEISALYDDGNNRTESEIEDKNSTQMVSTGANIKYRARNWHLALNSTYAWISQPINFGNSLYRSLLPGGQHFINTSLDYSYLYRNLQFFGETAVNQAGGVATLNGILSDIDPRISVALLHRYYSRKYSTPLGNSFGEGSSSNNESGLYLGVQSSFGKGVKLSSYFDMYSFRWLRFLTDAPSFGYEYLFKLDYNPNYRLNMYTQFRYEEKGSNLSGNTGKIDEIIAKKRQNWRLHLRYRVNSTFELRSRVEFSWYKDDEWSRGFMAYQDLVFTPKKVPLTAQFRFAVFDTDDYDTRIYAYENDVLYAFSVPPYYGRGIRYYLNLSYKPNRLLSFWVRFAQTHFADRDVISSGLGQINGSNRSEIKLQMRLKF